MADKESVRKLADWLAVRTADSPREAAHSKIATEQLVEEAAAALPAHMMPRAFEPKKVP